MARGIRIAGWVVVSLAGAAGASLGLAVAGDEPREEGKAKVEFRWLEDRPIPGVTEDKGIHISETDELSYPHLKPVLTNADVVEVKLSKISFMSPPSEHFSIKFELTKAARQRLAETCGETGQKSLTAMIDGRHCGAPFYLKSRDAANFAPYAGFLTSKEEADRVVATFKK